MRRLLYGCLASVAFGIAIATIPIFPPTTEPITYSTQELYAITAPSVVHIFAIPSGDKTHLFAGTGFFISSEGTIATAAHVIYDDDKSEVCPRLFIRVRPEEYYTIIPIKIDLEHDVAILRLDRKLLLKDKEKGVAHLKFIDGDPVTKKFDYLEMGNSRMLLPGDKLVVVGFPGKYTALVAEGILSSPSSQVIAMKEEDVTYKDIVLMSAMIFPGNSGGPVLNTQAEVIGIATVGTGKPISFFQRIEYIRTLLANKSEKLVTRDGLHFDKKYADDDEDE